MMAVSAELRRRAILESAAKLFSAQGHDATKMSDIIADIGGSKATLYKYFPSKEALIYAVIEMISALDFVAFASLVDGDAPIAERISEFCRALLEWLVDPKTMQVRRSVALEAYRSDLGKRMYEEDIRPAWTLIAQGFEREMEAGAMRRSDPWTAAMHLKALIEGYIPPLVDIKAIKRPGKKALREIADAASDVFIRAYVIQGASN
jgi:TetR/AcrR family transcriptional repressor of mexJK operon